MRVLYYIPSPHNVGADRWIYEGWKSGFEGQGHEFFELTDRHNFKNRIDEVRPDILFITNLADILLNHWQTLKWTKHRGIKVFLVVFWPLRPEEVNILKTEDVADVYFGEREPESMVEFEKVTGKKYHLMPNAANKLLHFPTALVPKYDYDIVYLGACLPEKKRMFKEILFPLKRKYRLGLFGPYWTLRDNVLRAGQKFCRKAKFWAGADLINRFRVSVSAEEENQLYSSAKICLNFHEREPDGSQPHCILNQRFFKIPACGGFQICDLVPQGRKYFSDDEVVMAKDPKDWFDKIDYYLSHDDERRRIQERGTARALGEHTYHNRVDKVIALYHCLGLEGRPVRICAGS